MVTYEFQNDAEAIDALAGVNLTIDPEKGIVRRARILSVVAAALFCLAAVLSKEPLIYLAGAAALLVLGYLTKSIRKRVIVKTIMKKSGDYLNGHATWTFAEDKIHTESNLGDGDAYWSAVQDYGDYDRYLYTELDEFLDLIGNAPRYLHVDAGALLARKRLTAYLQQHPLILRLHNVSFTCDILQTPFLKSKEKLCF